MAQFKRIALTAEYDAAIAAFEARDQTLLADTLTQLKEMDHTLPSTFLFALTTFDRLGFQRARLHNVLGGTPSFAAMSRWFNNKATPPTPNRKVVIEAIRKIYEEAIKPNNPSA